MATFYISRNKQFLLIVEGCGGYDAPSRERRIRIARMIKDLLDTESLDPTDFNSYDLSLLLGELSDEEHADIFEAYLNLF